MLRDSEHLEIVINKLGPLVLDERDSLKADDLKVYAVFYNAFMTWVKYEIKWYGIRKLAEYKDLLDKVIAPQSISLSGALGSITDDDLPTYRFSLLTRLTQSLRLRCTDEEWGATITQLINHQVCIYEQITPTSDGYPIYLHGEDIAVQVSRDSIKSRFTHNPSLVVLALLSLLPASTLFIREDDIGAPNAS